MRPEVVAAIVGVLKGGDPAALPPGATPGEKAAAKDAYLSEFVAERGKRDRQSQAWELLLTRSYDEPPTWKQIFDDLDPDGARPSSATLYDALPAGAQEEYARRYGVPVGRLTPDPRPVRHDPSAHRSRPPRRGALPAAVADRRGRHGHGLAGPRRAARPAGRDQAGALRGRAPTTSRSTQQRQRALREGRIAARLSHPHAISVYDVALENGQPWLVMEYLPSRSLAEVLTEDGVLRVDQAAQIGAQVADALAATHAAGIVHRDVKPANILIGEGGRVEGLVKITDFGISHASGDVTLTQTGQITGTPAFLAPEVAQGQDMTEASDVFSLGATLYTCLEGQPPFGMEDNALAMLHRVAGGRSSARRCAPGSLTQPLMKMLAADPRTGRP